MSSSNKPHLWHGRAQEPGFFRAEFTMEFEDMYAMRRLRSSRTTFGLYAAYVLLPVFFIAPAFAYGPWQRGDIGLAAAIVVGSVLAGGVVAALTYRPARSLVRGFWRGFFQSRVMIDRPVTMLLDRDGYDIASGNFTARVAWDGVVDIKEDVERYYFLYEENYAHTLPKRCFDQAARSELAVALKEWTGFETGRGLPFPKPAAAGQRL
ncbi:YcxB family protein [Inquilinus sp. OTU3971]|uniref:YcxB family protein n=1 Tax=Inquilinus sp. OTU3971 TaxID=3043855 RepID=UPI00313AC74D